MVGWWGYEPLTYVYFSPVSTYNAVIGHKGLPWVQRGI